ncbi:MAG: hypothetical protein NT076_04825 [Candidatus Pacearchaeota archaeon]|nr:hypothetical protein [Candidatus Pacearchaeota archaeon]
MAVAEAEEDERNIIFPGPLNSDQVRDLVVYLAKNLPGKCEIQLMTHRSERLGNKYSEQPEKAKQPLEIRVIRERLSGTISRDTPINSANMEFDVERAYAADCENLVYTGISFPGTPGYEPGELTSDDPSLIEDARKQVEDYFSP